MKQELYINQINYFLDETKDKITLANKQRENKDLTEIGYLFAINRLKGALQALELNFDNDIQSQIIHNITMFIKAQNDIKGKINYLDNNDKNYTLFNLIGGALTMTFILLTIADNPQSCCPINKDIILHQSIYNLENQLENAISNKDKPKIKQIKDELVLTINMYKENKKLLNKII